MTSVVSSEIASSKTSAFADPDQYRQALRGVDAELVIAGKGEFRAEVTRIDFPQLWMLRGHDTLPRIAWAKNTPSRAPITFLTRLNQAPVVDGGIELSPGAILFRSQGATFHMRSTGDCYWGGMSLTPEDLAAVGRTLVGRELRAPLASHCLHPTPVLMSRLMDLHARAGRLAETTPETLARPEAARALEKELQHLLVRCLADGTPEESSKGHHRHAVTVARLEDLLMANYERPLYLADVCAAIAVSERTLRFCTQEHLGMGPIQYLWLRRMNLARRALVRATSETTTVTAIATGCGFFELGRFAVEYRSLFGESPSVSLARTTVDPPVPRGGPFAFAT
jgi:AraC-like DNA-binding protein